MGRGVWEKEVFGFCVVGRVFGSFLVLRFELYIRLVNIKKGNYMIYKNHTIYCRSIG